MLPLGFSYISGGGAGPHPRNISKLELFSKISKKCHMMVNFLSFYLTFFKIF